MKQAIFPLVTLKVTQSSLREPERKSSAISSSASAVARSRKNSDYFNKLKEVTVTAIVLFLTIYVSMAQDEALAKKKQEEQEAKMKPEELKKLQEERRMAEEHNNSKTAHFSKLGAKYMPAKKKTPTGEIILERGGGGRGPWKGTWALILISVKIIFVSY